MTLLEAEVHLSLRDFLRQQGEPLWDHHLTMARLVSRGLRLDRSAIIQTGSTISRYGLSYLMPSLLSDRPILLVSPLSLQQRLRQQEIPHLQQWLNTDKVILRAEDDVCFDNFQGLLMVSPQAWLSDRLENKGRFPLNIPTLIDQADCLEEWTKNYLTVTISPDYWEQLQIEYPAFGNLIQEVRFFLKHTISSHPNSPYEYCLLDKEESSSFSYLCDVINQDSLLKEFQEKLTDHNQLFWASIDRKNQKFSLHLSPLEVASYLAPIWQNSPVILMGGFLDSNKAAPIYRDTIGLTEDILCLKFSPNRQNELIQLYIRDRLPMPNTAEFQGVLVEEIKKLVYLAYKQLQTIIIIVDDVPSKAQIGTVLASEFGTRVQVEKNNPGRNYILVSGWNFWHENQEKLPTPQLLIIATLPIPSLEDPLVAAQVTYYKKHHKDWFRFYLLPTALQEIQRAVMPLRESQGILALLDNRVNYRSYGNLILTALEPYAKINYLDLNWFEQ
ncbi:MAG: helicase C-terminal domain-containing protein [Cyanobacteria bacterium P01_G01_bin.49]